MDLKTLAASESTKATARILTHLCCSFSELLVFKVWVVGDATTCAELHPSKQLHATSKYSMLGSCRAAEDKGGRLVLDNFYTLWCMYTYYHWGEPVWGFTLARLHYACVCMLACLDKTTHCISDTQFPSKNTSQNWDCIYYCENHIDGC